MNWNEMTGKQKLLYAIAIGAVAGAVNGVINVIEARRQRLEAQHDLEARMQAVRLAERAKPEMYMKAEKEFDKALEEFHKKNKEDIDTFKLEMERICNKARSATGDENEG